MSKVSRDSLLSSAYLLTAHDVVAIYTKKVAPEIKAHIFCLAPMAIDDEEKEVEPHNVCVTMIRGAFTSCPVIRMALCKSPGAKNVLLMLSRLVVSDIPERMLRLSWLPIPQPDKTGNYYTKCKKDPEMHKITSLMIY